MTKQTGILAVVIAILGVIVILVTVFHRQASEQASSRQVSRPSVSQSTASDVAKRDAQKSTETIPLQKAPDKEVYAEVSAAIDSGKVPADELLSEEKQPPEKIEAAIVTLGKKNRTDAFAEVLALADGAADQRVRAAAIRNIVLVGGREHPEETVAMLTKALADSSLSIQAEALRALGRFPERITPAERRRINILAHTKGSAPEERRVREAARMLLRQLDAFAAAADAHVNR